MKTNILKIFFLLIMVSCEKPEFNEYTKTVSFEARYRNPGSNNPQFEIINESVPDALNISGLAAESSTITGRSINKFNEVTFSDKLGIYKLVEGKKVTEIFENGSWNSDSSENFLNIIPSQSFCLVLVLDVSSSLGNDVTKVKEYAIDFITSVNEKMPNSRIGVIGFSSFIQVLPLTDNLSNAISFINALPENQNETKLYEAMKKGLDLLDPASEATKTMVTFTDGKNQSWTDEIYNNTSSYIFDQIEAHKDINSYVVGLKGKELGVEEDKLNRLVSGSGIASYPGNTNELQNVFLKLASNVVTAYTMIYDRNISPITEWIKLRFTLTAKLQ